MGTGSLCRIFICMQGTDLTGRDTGNTMDSLGKIIPGTYSFITEMINSRNHSLINGCKDSTCQITGICRCTNLIKDHTQSFLFLSQTEHRFYKIIPKSGIKPCGTDNHCFFAILQCIRFTGQLGLAGVVYCTDAFSAGLTPVDEATKEMCGQVIYPAAVLKAAPNAEAAKEFLAYLQTDKAMTVFEGVGFSAV